jgi:hypothetical protein
MYNCITHINEISYRVNNLGLVDIGTSLRCTQESPWCDLGVKEPIVFDHGHADRLIKASNDQSVQIVSISHILCIHTYIYMYRYRQRETSLQGVQFVCFAFFGKQHTHIFQLSWSPTNRNCWGTTIPMSVPSWKRTGSAAHQSIEICAGWLSLDSHFGMDYPTYPLVNKQFAIENGPVEIVSFPMKNGGSFHSYVSLPEGTSTMYNLTMGRRHLDTLVTLVALRSWHEMRSFEIVKKLLWPRGDESWLVREIIPKWP